MNKDHIIIHNFSILIFREFLLKVFAFLGQIVLARILNPQDFGFYAIIIFILNIFMLFSDIGLSSAIIQKKEDITSQEISSILFTKTALNSFLTVILFITAPFAPIFFHSLSMDQVHMIQVLSITLLFSAYRSISISFLEKDLNYRAVAFIDAVGVLLFYIFAIAFAVTGFGLWSLILATVCKELFETILAIMYKPVNLRFSLNVKRIKDLFHFGVFIQGNGILTFINNSINPIIGGSMLPTFQVGLLDWGNNIISIPESITNNYGRVAFASFAKIQHDITLLSEVINKSIRILSFITILIMILLFAFGKEATLYFFSSKWLPGVPALYWLTGGILFYAISSPVCQGLFALKKSKEVFYATLITTCFAFGFAIFLTNAIGFLGIAISITIAEGILCILYTSTAKKSHIQLDLFLILFPRILIGAICLLFSLFLNSVLYGSFLFFLCKIFLGSGTYVFLSFISIPADRRLLIEVKKLIHL